METPPRSKTVTRFRSTPIVCFLLSICLFASGCTTMQTVAIPGPRPGGSEQPPTVHVGDEVEVHAKGGQRYSFKITSIETDALVGGKIRVKYDDMTELRVLKLSKGYTALTLGAILYTILVVGVIVALSHIGPGMTGG